MRDDAARLRLSGDPARGWLQALSTALEAAGEARTVVLENPARRIPEDGLSSLLKEAAGAPAAVPAIAVRDTYKRVEGGMVLETVDRETLVELLDPWIFERRALEGAIAAAGAMAQPCEGPVDLCRLGNLPVRVLRWPA